MTSFNGESVAQPPMGARVDRVEALAISNARAIEALTQSVNTVAEAVGRTLRAVDELREIVEEDRVNFRERLDRADVAITSINATLASINAAIERHDKILDYLLRRDGSDSNDLTIQ